MVTAWPRDNTEYTAKDIGAYNGTRTRGVLSAEDCFTVTATGGRGIAVSPGLAWLKPAKYWGVSFLSDASEPFLLDVASGTLSRYAAIVLQIDMVANTQRILVRYGALAATPALLKPVQDVYCDEVIVSQVLQKAGSTAVTAADITDTRLDEAYCGLMRDGVTRIPTAQISAQASALISTLQKALADVQDGAYYAHVDNFTATLLATGWSATAPYTQTVAVTGMVDTMEPICDIVLTGTAADAAALEAYACVSRIASGVNSITATCLEDKPGAAIDLKFKVVR